MGNYDLLTTINHETRDEGPAMDTYHELLAAVGKFVARHLVTRTEIKIARHEAGDVVAVTAMTPAGTKKIRMQKVSRPTIHIMVENRPLPEKKKLTA